jgi:hypothetical protein
LSMRLTQNSEEYPCKFERLHTRNEAKMA